MTETQRGGDDVIVVGAGLAGCMTALTVASRNPNASVRVLSLQEERFATHSGLIEVLGYSQSKTPEEHGEKEKTLPTAPVTKPFSELTSLPESHPYRIVGKETIREALWLFDETVPGYHRGTPDQNGLVVVGNGRISPALCYPESVQQGLISRSSSMLLVGFVDLPQWNAELAAARLDERVSYDVDAITIELPVVLAEGATPTAVARALDENDTLRRVLAERIEEEVDTQSRVGLPAVLGLTESQAIHTELQEELYSRPFEIPLGRPSVLGARLQSALFAALADADIAVERDCEITDYSTADGRIAELTGADETYEAVTFVLATGGVATGGIQGKKGEQSGHTVLEESVFGCRIEQPDDRQSQSPTNRLSLTSERLFDRQPFACAGVPADERFQPLTGGGTVQYENLWAVGECLSGVDTTSEGSHDGIGLATGYSVGKQLAKRE